MASHAASETSFAEFSVSASSKESSADDGAYASSIAKVFVVEFLAHGHVPFRTPLAGGIGQRALDRIGCKLDATFVSND